MAYKKRRPTFKYAQYAGQDSDYLPGEVYGSTFNSYQRTPQEMIDYRVKISRSITIFPNIFKLK